MILNPTSGGSASVAAAVRAVEVKSGETVNAGQFVQVQREGVTVPTFDGVLTFPAERTAICALSETKLVAFYATTENGMYNLYATVAEKENGAWTEGVPVLVNCEETGQGYGAYTPVTAVKVSSDIVIVDTSQRESGIYNYWHELVAVKVSDDNVVTAGNKAQTRTGTSFYWVSSNAILEYAGEHNALFHCGFTENYQVAESDRSGRKIIGVTVDPTTLELKVGSAYNYLSDWINSNSAVCRYANAVHLSDNRLLFAAAYQEAQTASSSAVYYRIKIAVVAVNEGGVSILSTKTTATTAGLTDSDMPCLFKVDSSNILMLQNKVCWKIVLAEDKISTFTAIDAATVAPTITDNPTLKVQVDDTTTMYIWNASTYMRAQLFHVTDIDTPVSADTYIAVSDSLGNGTDNTAKATSSGRKIWFLTSNLYLNEADIVPTEYAYPCYDRIDGVAKTGGNGGDIINVYVPEA